MHKCILPWISIETTPHGNVRPCCLYTQELPDINLNTHTLQDAFISVGRRPLEVAATLRTSPLMAFFKVAMPLARPGFITAAILGFAHTLGEFGVVLMIGGNIPGETRVASIAIYDHVESLEYAQAHILAAVLLIVSFVMLVAVFILNRRFRTVRL